MRPLVKYIASLLLLCALFGASVATAQARRYNVLVLCAYNPDSNNLAEAITKMEEDLKQSGVNINISVKSLGYDYLSGFSTWRGKMAKVLRKYKAHNIRPDIIVTIGQEAMSAYLSQDVSQMPDIPVICGMCSRNYIELPSETVNISEWKPECHDILEAATLYNIVGGFFYTYDVEKNVNLIRSLCPQIKRVAFLSDNSYGGINLKSLVLEYASHHRDVAFEWLDGRDLTIQSATDTIAHLRNNTALLIGTWRFDKDSRYFITSSTSILKQNNRDLPVFTLTATGLRDWAIGGFIPDYRNSGELLASAVLQYLTIGKASINFTPSYYVFNANSIEAHGIDKDKLPDEAKFINKQLSVFEQYASQIAVVACIIAVLTLCLIISIHNLRKVRNLKSELERKQKELIVAKNKAENNSMLKTSFLANMSHEIRTPLNAVVGFSQVIASQCDSLDAEERNRIIEIINKNCNLLTGLINSILDISRIESDRAKYEIEEIDLVETCQTMLSSVQMANNGLPIEFILDTNLQKFIFNTDRQRFQQVLMNLLGNSVKFTLQGAVTLSLVREADGSATVTVTDTGKGIPPDKAEEVFGRFVKLDEYSNGTGLGLSLCRLIVEKFHGKIWVDTNYTSGARFVFVLPPITKDDIY